MNKTLRRVVGIDPGVSGAIAFCGIAGESVVVDMPTVPFGNGKGFVKRMVDADALAFTLSPEPDEQAVLYIEQVNAFPGQGVASMFSLGMSFGIAKGVAAGLHYEVKQVRPQEWKAHFGLDSDKRKALALARKLFPTEPLNLAKYHNRAEALLIARYGLFKETGK